ncbi:DUF1802 family protein [Dolichospermum compactum]|uniref:DUF1802 domain-containing protein n=1 Tax=Dolichospermum compactum NIES-806 TaxID=1973481 RepID=A0A1Z4V942_9CYAN|nr:DUF1802 family protein [Dolichospermum compactum]BAZ88047.1 hypothetical protein NIES806_42810 [Dolichospermum compactum NIES-806]
MNKYVSIYNALCLPAPDVEALIQGQIIAAIPRKLLTPGQKFALYPVDTSVNVLSIKAWAKCELCEILDQTTPLDMLSQLTIWKPEIFQEILQNRPHFFLAYLRVYHLPEPLEIRAIPNIQEKLGKFAPLPNNISVSEDKPVLSDYVFNQRKQQLENRQPPLHPELEELQSTLSQIANNNPVAQQLENEIKVFLGWSNAPTTNTIDADLTWIKTIASLGDRSIEFEEKKNSYQAGTDFENIARDSLDFLGFKVETAYKGGAGGLDLYCSQPYPLVCECKAGKSIPSGTVEELLKLGGMHLGADKFLNSPKLVIGPGNATSDNLKSSKEWKVSIIKAMTLQKLVELKAKYPGAINLIELKQYLEPGQIDDKINEYIDKVEKEIKLRSHLVQLIKKADKKVGIEYIEGVYDVSNPPQTILNIQEMHDILIELSSPLTGYLGREKGTDWKTDKFYYLRDLPIN